MDLGLQILVITGQLLLPLQVPHHIKVELLLKSRELHQLAIVGSFQFSCFPLISVDRIFDLRADGCRLGSEGVVGC